MSDQPVTKAQLDALERAADKVFKKLGIDIEFTHHFLDRVNDERNRKQITVRELGELLAREYQKWGKRISGMPADSEAVMKSLGSAINIPFVINDDPRNNEKDLVAKTVMRKKKFHSPDPALTVEDTSSLDNLQSFDEADVHEMWESYKQLDEITDPREFLLRKALQYLDNKVKSNGDRQTLGGYAFDVFREINLTGVISVNDFLEMYREWKGESAIHEGFMSEEYYYDNMPLAENAAGIIDKQNTTVDVKPGETQRQAAKFGNKVDSKNQPPLLHANARKNSDPNTLSNLGLSESVSYPLAPENEWYGDLQYKDQGAKLVLMAPDKYLSMIKPLELDDASVDNIEDLANHIKSGRKLDPLKIYPDGGEDGRHRAYAAKQLGVKRVPVIIWPKKEVIDEHGTLDTFAPSRIDDLIEMLDEKMEQVDSDGMHYDSENDPEYKKVEKAYRALMAVHNVLQNHKIAQNNRHQDSVFVYDIKPDQDIWGGLHAVIDGEDAEIKWLGSYGASGSKLLQQAKQYLRQEGVKNIKLSAKWDSEPFYAKHGFDRSGEKTFDPFANANSVDMQTRLGFKD